MANPGQGVRLIGIDKDDRPPSRFTGEIIVNVGEGRVVPNRNPDFVPIFTMENLQSAPDLRSTGEGREVSRVVRLADGGCLLEFSSEAGHFYQVEYSPDLLHWKLSPTTFQAGGNRVQWIDRGPPHTDAPPASVPSRYYRIRKANP